MRARKKVATIQRQHKDKRGAKTAEQWDRIMDLEESSTETPLVYDRKKLRDELFPPCSCYRSKAQEPGDGSKRIGTPLSLREDLYSLLYISTIRFEIINDAKAKRETKDEEIKAFIASKKTE